MRHLIVPSVATQHWLDEIKSRNWLELGIGVLTMENGMKAIPLNNMAPVSTDQIWQSLAHIEIVRDQESVKHWTDLLDRDLYQSLKDYWPRAYEVVGDIIILKLEPEVFPHRDEIGKAMLERIPNVRLVCADNGVSGDFRVRNLLPIISRDGNLSTRTKIREHGKVIWTDPAKAYFSARLSNERMQNLVSAKDLRDRLNAKIRICDPYAGVGPGIMPLLSEPNLVSHCYAGDLNPDAFDLLELNLQESFSKSQTTHAEVILKNQDARKWKSDENYLEQIDFLLVNLPHDSINHLPDLIPLLSRGSLTKIRGWAIINKAELNNSQQEITRILENFSADVEYVSCSEIKGFSSSKIFMRFETIQSIPLALNSSR